MKISQSQLPQCGMCRVLSIQTFNPILKASMSHDSRHLAFHSRMSDGLRHLTVQQELQCPAGYLNTQWKWIKSEIPNTEVENSMGVHCKSLLKGEGAPTIDGRQVRGKK
jgi:hypothetical protein